MTDKKLLEMAAKAAGIQLEGVVEQGVDAGKGVLVNGLWWAPLHDDGDAFRLAVKLGERFPCCVVGIFNRAAFPHASTSVVHRDGTETYIEQENGDEDVGTATRRAIVRAGAEIGKAML